MCVSVVCSRLWWKQRLQVLLLDGTSQGSPGLVVTLQQELQLQEEPEANTQARLATVEHLLNEYVALFHIMQQECKRLREELDGVKESAWVPLAVTARGRTTATGR